MYLVPLILSEKIPELVKAAKKNDITIYKI
jgi:hypothetical protein